MEEDILGLDSILSEEDAGGLFEETPEKEETVNEPEPQNKEVQENKTETEKETLTEEEQIDEEDLFSPESVGKEKEDNKDGKEPSSEKKDTSQQQNFYSSIAQAFKEEGVFPDLEDDEIAKIDSAEKFKELFDKQVKSSLDERQQRIDNALDAGVEPDDVRKYEYMLDKLYEITEEDLADEGKEGETLRKNLIYQDFINRGYSKERAVKEVNKSFNAQSDVEDAKEALAANIEHINQLYQEKIDEAKEKENELKEANEKQAELLKKSILEDEKVFGDLEVDKATRQRIYNNITRPVYRDPKTGQFLNAVQKYEKEHSTEFLKNVALVSTLTDGFKNFDGLVGKKVKKEVAKGFRELERKINSTSRNPDGSLKFASGVDTEQKLSEFGKTWDLA